MDRSDYIGGSDWFEVRTGCWRRLWLDKRGGGGPEQTGAMRRGQALEDVVAREYARATGRQVRRVNELVRRASNGIERWYGAHIDRYAIDEQRPRGQRMGILEVKTENPWRYREIVRGGLPEHWLDQVHWYSAVARRPWADIIVCEPLDWQIHIAQIPLSAARIAELLEMAAMFQRHLEHGPAPDALPPDDRRCQRCRYRSQCHPAEIDDSPIEDAEAQRDDSLIDLVEADIEARRIVREAQAHAEDVRAQLREALAGRRSVACGLYQIQVRTAHRKAYTVPESTFEQIVIKEPK